MDHSPAESFLSIPSDNYSSLFTSTADSPSQMMTPVSTTYDDSRESVAPEDAEADSSQDSSDKKPTKKRKSWGQVLPEPKTNLPPRKRAKTEDEKEQRRVERVLRNRRAAQSSRERKRQEVEALEQRNQELERAFAESQKANQALVEELRRLRGDQPSASRIPSLESFKENVTLSPQLFGVDNKAVIDDLVKTPAQNTVNPASLSPVPTTDFLEQAEPVFKDEEAPSPAFEDLSVQPSASTSDVTQRPAVSHIGGEAPGAHDFSGVEYSLPPTHDDVYLGFGDLGDLSAANNANSALLEGELASSPESAYLDDDTFTGDSAADFFHQSTYGLDITQLLTEENTELIGSAEIGAEFLNFEPQAYNIENQVS